MKNQHPNQHLIALVTFLSLVPLVYYIPDWISPFLPESKILNVVAAVGIIVPIVSYIVLPTFVKVYQRWRS